MSNVLLRQFCQVDLSPILQWIAPTGSGSSTVHATVCFIPGEDDDDDDENGNDDDDDERKNFH